MHTHPKDGLFKSPSKRFQFLQQMQCPFNIVHRKIQILTYPVASHGGSHARDSGWWKVLIFHTEVFRVVLTDKPLWDRYLLRSQPSKPLTSQLRADRYFTGFNSFSVSRTGRQVKRPAMVKAERLHCFIQLNAGITNRYVILDDGVDTLLVHLPKVIKCLQTPVSVNSVEFVVCTR